MSNAFCTKCGAPLAPGAAFCSSCGERIQTQAQPVYNAASPQPQYAYQQPQYGYQQPGYPVRRSNTGRIIAIIAAAAVVIAGVVLLIVLLGGGGGIKPGELNGTWTGNATITQISPQAYDFGLSSSVGDEEDFQMTVSLNEDGTGTIEFEGVGTLDATYKGGELSARITNEYAPMDFTFEGGVSKTNGGYSFSGTLMFITSDKTAVLVQGSMEASMELE